MPTVQGIALGDLYAQSARLFGDRIAVVAGETVRTFSELDSRASRLAAAFAQRGLRHGDRIAILSQNRPEYLEVLGAAAKTGAVLVPLNIRLGAAEVAFILEDSGARLLLAEPALWDAIEESARPATLEEVVRLDAGPGDRAYEALLDGAAPGGAPPLLGDDDLLALMYTAAVQGRPRGAMMNHRSFVYQSLRIQYNLTLSDADCYLNALPLFHTAGLSFALAVFQIGARNVLLDRFDAEEAARLIAAQRVTYFAGFAPMFSRLLDAARSTGADLSSLRGAIGRDSTETMQAFMEEYPDVAWFCGYGQTETQGTVATSPLSAEDLKRPRLRARVAPLNLVRIVDEADQDVPCGGAGEIVVRGPNVTVGYWGQPEVTERQHRHGWHHTGDLGRLDGEGYLWFLGPMDEKELIKTGGENVYPREVESALEDHPSVREVCVIGVPDPEWSEAVKAVVVLAPEATVGAEELREFCRTRLGRYKVPKPIQFVPELPHQPGGGGIDRHQVKALHGAAETGAQEW